jgi:hypothetical protein
MFTFVESSAFERVCSAYLDENEYAELQQYMIQNLRYEPNEFWMLTVYAKAKHDTIPAHILKQLLEAFGDE